MAEEELAREAAALRAAGRALEPYIDRIRDLERKVGLLEDNQKLFRDLREDVRALKEDAAYASRHAEEDRKRLVASIKDDLEGDTQTAIKDYVTQVFRVIQINIDKPDEFTELMSFLRGFRKTIDDTRRHVILAIAGSVILGAMTIIWKYVISGGGKP